MNILCERIAIRLCAFLRKVGRIVGGPGQGGPSGHLGLSHTRLYLAAGKVSTSVYHASWPKGNCNDALLSERELMRKGAEVRQLPGFPLCATMLQDVLSEGPIACLIQNIWSITQAN